ncbi:hypothetical protein Tco_1468270 [Tanacetum coccineum]
MSGAPSRRVGVWDEKVKASILSYRHYYLLLGTDFCNAPSLHKHDKLLTLAASGWPFVSAVPGQMTHLVASLTLDSARSCVMQGAFLTQGKASSIPIVFSWGDNISPDSFLPSILLLLVIIVAVAIVVTVILVVVVVGCSSITKLSFVIIGSLHRMCFVT